MDEKLTEQTPRRVRDDAVGSRTVIKEVSALTDFTPVLFTFYLVVESTVSTSWVKDSTFRLEMVNDSLCERTRRENDIVCLCSFWWLVFQFSNPSCFDKPKLIPFFETITTNGLLFPLFPAAALSVGQQSNMKPRSIEWSCGFE